MTSSSIVLHVARGIDRARRMRHRRIAEHPHDVQQCVGVAERRDVEQRLRAGLRAAGAGDVGEFHRRRHALARVEQRREPVEPLVGHARDADVRFRLAARARRFARAGQQLEEGGFARRGKADQSCTEHVRLRPLSQICTC